MAEPPHSASHLFYANSPAGPESLDYLPRDHSFDDMDVDEEAVQGLVRRQNSNRYTHYPWMSMPMARSASRAAAYLGQDLSTMAGLPSMAGQRHSREMSSYPKRRSRVISALPELPMWTRSGEWTSLDSAHSPFPEKSSTGSSALSLPAAGHPPGPPGPRNHQDPDLVLWDGGEDPGNVSG
jgi:hypothetical protein